MLSDFGQFPGCILRVSLSCNCHCVLASASFICRPNTWLSTFLTWCRKRGLAVHGGTSDPGAKKVIDTQKDASSKSNVDHRVSRQIQVLNTLDCL